MKEIYCEKCPRLINTCADCSGQAKKEEKKVNKAKKSKSKQDG